MKRMLVVLGISFLCIGLNAENSYYFYNYEGKKIYLSLNTEYAFLSLKEQKLPVNIQQHYVKIAELKSDKSDQKRDEIKKRTDRFYTVLNFEKKMSNKQYLELLLEMKCKNKDMIISPYFRFKDDDIVGLSNFFYVKLKEKKDTILLTQMTKQTGTVIIEQDPFMPLWYVLSTTEVSEQNAMECSNLFYESGLFQAAEPDLMLNNLSQCTNDAYFNNQWGLKNIGQSAGTRGVDINACDAWQISKGNNITVAVIDHGIELDHPDLEANIHSLSYDCENRSSPSIVRGAHGTLCAGIVGAVQNNAEGISGVAPNCKLMSISNSLSIGIYPPAAVRQQQNLANGIEWAYQNGADVISCSWGNALLQGQFISDAIDDAVIRGRKDKGCIVVFASGNDAASTVLYPASLPNVIAVGSITNKGQHDIGSNYGTALDVVAPGAKIYTTDRQGDVGENTIPGAAGNYCFVSGTSMATPHVAGIAALILSVNPYLTGQQVRDIIESTTQKVNSGLYTYSTTSGRPNGTWNNEMGYGLVDAYAAVQRGCEMAVNFIDQTVTADETIISCGDINVQNVTVTGNNVKLTLDAAGTTTISSDFEVVLGSELEVLTR